MTKYLVLALLLASCGGVQDRGIVRKLPPTEEVVGRPVQTPVQQKKPEKLKVEQRWTHQPFEGIENCIDTIAFAGLDTGYYYACEQEMTLPINRYQKNGSVLMQVWGYTTSLHDHDHDHSHQERPKLEVISKYTMTVTDSEELRVQSIEHLGPEGFKKVDEAYANQFFQKLD